MNITVRGIELRPITWDDWSNPAPFAGPPTWMAGDFNAGRSPSSSLFRFGRNKRPHLGIDIGKSHRYGDGILAGAEGVVVRISKTYFSGAGRFVQMAHNVEGHLTYSYYIHLASVAVKVGQRLSRGQRLGTMGGSGFGRNKYYTPHLHTEIWQYVLRPRRNGADRTHKDPELVYFGSGSGKKGYPRSMKSDVIALQGYLNSLGAGLTVDGDFGPRSLQAVKQYTGSGPVTPPPPPAIIGIPPGRYVGTEASIEIELA